ncbi:MAG: hypothetical protein GX638_08990, partial [Crenarchaeota archaeon]|nr:hypothetical protein [Thermoproteota archaeon]
DLGIVFFGMLVVLIGAFLRENNPYYQSMLQRNALSIDIITGFGLDPYDVPIDILKYSIFWFLIFTVGLLFLNWVLLSLNKRIIYQKMITFIFILILSVPSWIILRDSITNFKWSMIYSLGKILVVIGMFKSVFNLYKITKSFQKKDLNPKS